MSEEKSSLSRRDFLKGGAIAVTGSMAAGALNAYADEGEPEQASWLPSAWDYETDVLVIGYGGAGLWAALTAKDEGESEVLVLEKAPVRGGGNTSINMGEFTWISDEDLGYEYIKNFTHGMTPEPIARAYAAECALNIDYAEKWGLEPTIQPGSMASGMTKNCEYTWAEGAEAFNVVAMSQDSGIGGWTVLDKARQDQGIEVIFNCHDEELIQDPVSKEILGTYVMIGDELKTVKARKGTIITTGGFEFNEELKNKYFRCYPARGFYGWPYNTGDGVKMVERVGGQMRNMFAFIGGECAWFKENPQPYAFQCSQAADNFIYINRLGKRWRNEKAGRMLDPHNGWHIYTAFNESIIDFENIPTWVIMDQNVIDAGPLGPTLDGFLMGMYLPDLPAELGRFDGWSVDNSREIADGWIKKGETIEELVDVINAHMESLAEGYQFFPLDPEVVKESIDTYNSYCADGVDKDFNRQPETLLPVATGPFYAYPMFPGGGSTLGGAKKNENAQVLDCDDNPIPRLYAAGSFGNMACHTYGISGGNNSENMVWGRIAARHASSLPCWDE